jgi:hypothetical protein
MTNGRNLIGNVSSTKQAGLVRKIMCPTHRVKDDVLSAQYVDLSRLRGLIEIPTSTAFTLSKLLVTGFV